MIFQCHFPNYISKIPGVVNVNSLFPQRFLSSTTIIRQLKSLYDRCNQVYGATMKIAISMLNSIEIGSQLMICRLVTRQSSFVMDVYFAH